TAEQAGDKLSTAELISIAFELSAAGHETTANLIGTLTFTLLRDRRLWEGLCADPSLLQTTIEEGLRYEPPLRILAPRFPDRDVELSGVVIPANEPVRVWIGAANRDGTAFPDPDTFQLDRAKNRHHSFSAGPHFCLGAQLARLEARVAMNALVRRLPSMELIDHTPQWRPTYSLRALEKLPVRWQMS
ncbi:MAG: cytochrome P450, partial [Rhizorhabdus sp.]